VHTLLGKCGNCVKDVDGVDETIVADATLRRRMYMVIYPNVFRQD
jgi:hypothetical protein